jgi:glycosyltransferase involved in cell wall biosynthesis
MVVKVGFLSPSLRMGGAERWMLGLARHCDPSRVQWVGTALAEWSREHTNMTREMNRYMPIYGPLVRPESPDHCHEFVRRPGPDASTGIGIIGAQADVILSWVEGRLGTMLGYYRQHYNVKVVAVSHSNWPQCMGGVQNEAGYLTAVSDGAKAGYWPDANRTIDVIHNGADVDRVVPVIGRKAFRAKHGLSDGDFVLTYIGRFSKEKNPLVAAETAKYMGKQFKAMYVGGGDTTEGYSDREWLPALEHAASGQYIHTGQMTSIGDALAATNVLINCSHNEGFCLTIIEAWLAGVPVVSTSVGAIPELEKIYGPMVVQVPNSPSAKDVADAVVLATSHGWRNVIDKARNVAWNTFTTPAMAERWTNYIEHITKK